MYSLCRIYLLFLASSTCYFFSATIVCDRWRIGAVNVYNLSASIWDDHVYVSLTVTINDKGQNVAFYTQYCLAPLPPHRQFPKMPFHLSLCSYHAVRTLTL
jgi:hypothetical protein